MYREKGAWILTGTKLPEKVRLLTKVLVNTMALASEQILHFLGNHWLIPVVGR
jgi:hypothetical protein